MSYLAQRGSVYYFRRTIPDELRPVIGRREIMLSLRTKDREAAKRLIPAEIIKSDALFSEARKAMAVPLAETIAPKPKSQARLDRERGRWEYEQEQEALRSAEMDGQEWIADEIDGYEKLLAHDPLGPQYLADVQERITLARMEGEAKARLALENRRVSESQNQAVECQPDITASKGKGVYLDTDIVDLWAAERSPADKTKDSYKRVAEWLHERIGRKSVEQFTRKDILAFKDKLLSEKQTPQNVNVKLGNLRTLLQWAVDNDYAETNAASGIVLKAPAVDCR